MAWLLVLVAGIFDTGFAVRQWSGCLLRISVTGPSARSSASRVSAAVSCPEFLLQTGTQ